MGLEGSIPSTYGGVEPSFLEKWLLAGHDDASDQLVNLTLVIPVCEGVSAEESSGRSTCGAALVSPAGVSKPLGDLIFGDGQGCLGWVGACEVLDPMCAGRNG